MVDRNTLVRQHRYLVKWLMTKLAPQLPRCADWDDLWAAGLCELVEASRRYDPAKGASFADYAHNYVRYAILVSARFWIDEEARRSKLDSADASSVADISASAGLAPGAVQRRLLERHETGIRLATVVEMGGAAEMSGSGSETLTAALRRLADERASGLLSVATPWHDVVLELADGTPIGIGPTPDVDDRVAPEPGPALVAAAVVEELVDRTVAAIVDGGGDCDWTWDACSDAETMPLPTELATELSRRAADAARAMATLDADLVLHPGRDLELHAELGRIRELFDGERSIQDVAEIAGLTVPTAITLAAALMRADALWRDVDDPAPTSWSDLVARFTSPEVEQDEPEAWVMDDPEDVEEPQEAKEAMEAHETAADATQTDGAAPSQPSTAPPSPASGPTGEAPPDAGHVPADPAPAIKHGVPEAMAWVTGDGAAATATPAPPTGSDVIDADDGAWAAAWDDTNAWGQLDRAGAGRQPANGSVVETSGGLVDQPQDTRTALSMTDELQAGGDGGQAHEQPPVPDAEEREGEAAPAERETAGVIRKKPTARPDEVTDFFRELSRLGFD